ALATRGKDRIRQRRNDGRESRLAQSGRWILGDVEMHLDGGGLIHPEEREVVKVALYDAPVLECDLRLRGTDPVDDAPLHLIHRAGGIDDLAANIGGHPNFVDLE